MKTCEVDGCNSPIETQGLRKSRGKRTSNLRIKYCRKHVRWFSLYGTTDPQKFSQDSLLSRLMRGVIKNPDSGCWEWQLSSKSRRNEYGNIWDNAKKKTVLAHRVSYELTKGKIPKGKIIMHTCDNPKCVNPEHLLLGTQKLNCEDRAKKGRSFVNKFFGEQNPKSKLTLEQAKFIKSHPEMGHKQIADMWGVSPNCIRGVRIGRTWKDA